MSEHPPSIPTPRYGDVWWHPSTSEVFWFNGEKWERSMADDKAWIRKVRSIDDPIEILRTITEHEHLLGYDPYYKELRAAMLETAERIVRAKEPHVHRIPFGEEHCSICGQKWN